MNKLFADLMNKEISPPPQSPTPSASMEANQSEAPVEPIKTTSTAQEPTHLPSSHTDKQAIHQARTQTGSHASMRALKPMESLTSAQDNLIRTVRKVVRRLGKETVFCRLTSEEKRALGDLVYTHKVQGMRTSENEIVRIALAYLIEDYKENGKSSVLECVLASLNEW